MKKILALILAITTCVSLVACVNKANDGDGVSTTPTENATTVQTETKPQKEPATEWQFTKANVPKFEVTTKNVEQNGETRQIKTTSMRTIEQIDLMFAGDNSVTKLFKLNGEKEKVVSESGDAVTHVYNVVRVDDSYKATLNLTEEAAICENIMKVEIIIEDDNIDAHQTEIRTLCAGVLKSFGPYLVMNYHPTDNSENKREVSQYVELKDGTTLQLSRQFPESNICVLIMNVQFR